MTDTLVIIFSGTSIALLALGLAMAGRLSGRTCAEQTVKAGDRRVS